MTQQQTESKVTRDDRGGDIITFNDPLFDWIMGRETLAISVGCNNQDMVSKKGCLNVRSCEG